MLSGTHGTAVDTDIKMGESREQSFKFSHKNIKSRKDIPITQDEFDWRKTCTKYFTACSQPANWRGTERMWWEGECKYVLYELESLEEDTEITQDEEGQELRGEERYWKMPPVAGGGLDKKWDNVCSRWVNAASLRHARYLIGPRIKPKRGWANELSYSLRRPDGGRFLKNDDGTPFFTKFSPGFSGKRQVGKKSLRENDEESKVTSKRGRE